MNNPAKYIDTFIYKEVPNETPAYQAIIRERILDLCQRRIAADDASVYLKTGGWNPEIAKLYVDFIAFCEEQDKPEPEVGKAAEGLTMTQNQVIMLLRALLTELAEAAGFRKPEEDEDTRDYRADFTEFLRKGKNGIDTEVLDLIIQQLSSVKEISSAQLAYFQDMKDNQ
jgi:hypothetical protein